MIVIYCFKDYYKYFEDYVNSLLVHIPNKKKIVKYTCPDKLLVHFKKKFQSRGSGSIALQKFLKKTGKNRFLAHINPTNYKSIQFFGKNGFTHIQNTYHKKINS